MMKHTLLTFAATLLAFSTTETWAQAANDKLPPAVSQKLAALDVAWDAPGGEMASMPIGNGDITANVWVETDGDLVFYLGKSDAWDEINCLLKIGRVRVSFTPALPTADFSQRLDLRSGTVVITAGTGADRVTVRVWVDANHPVLRVEQLGGQPRACTAKVELWRNEDKPLADSSHTHTEEHITQSGASFKRLGDTVLPPIANRISWCHRNTASLYPVVLKAQHLEALAAKHPDPLLMRTFGATAFGSGMKASAPLTLTSETPAEMRTLSFVLLTAQTPTLDDWTAQIHSLTEKSSALPLAESRAAHAAWWEQFWSRSWLIVADGADADIVTRGYNLQRYMIGASSRGKYPPKFNGGAFTVNMGGKCPFAENNPDYRSWGGSCYWFQNNRFLSWPSLAAGDYDLMLPFFNMYRDMLAFRMDVTKSYYGHAGAFFPETYYFWGAIDGQSFGWKNPGNTLENQFIRYEWQGGIEQVAMMLDYHAHTRDDAFAKATMLPIAEAVATFYDQHWKRDASGKIRLDPTAALETFDAVNDAPTLAGLHSILPRLLSLPENLTTDAQRTAWKKMLADLPPLPSATGKDNIKLLTPADKYWGRRNCENPELYAIFPYRLYGLGLPGLQVAKDTFAARSERHQVCWSQDCIQAAQLGLTEEAKQRTVGKFSAPSAPQKFPAFWNPNWNCDWTPDMDHGGTAALALTEMLMQCPTVDQILLFPAWPNDWNVSFKLHAPKNTTVEGEFRDGKVVKLIVTPQTRHKDVEICQPFAQ